MKKLTGLEKGVARTEEKDPTLDISSLIDVSFLLLIYFVVTSTLNPTESDLKLTMGPTPKEGLGVFIDHPTIGLNEAGVVFYESELLDFDIDRHELVLLLDRLNTYKEASRLISSGEPPRVNFKVSNGAKGQRFIDVMNCLAEVGISNVTFLDME